VYLSEDGLELELTSNQKKTLESTDPGDLGDGRHNLPQHLDYLLPAPVSSPYESDLGEELGRVLGANLE